MRREGGYACITSPDGVAEYDSYTCSHCQRINLVKPKQRAEDLGGLCKQCMGLICSQCVSLPCRPFEKQLEAWEARDRFRRSIDG